MRRPHRIRQTGATTIEFALAFMLFLTFVLGVVDFSRMLWTWNAATEATRWGARTAVTCDRGAARVLSNMQFYLPELRAENLVINWHDATGVSETCDQSTCTGVNVQIVNLPFVWLGPIGFGGLGFDITLPPFSTYLPREIMGQDDNSAAVCS